MRLDTGRHRLPWHAVGLISWNAAGVRMARAMVLPWPAIASAAARAMGAAFYGLPRLAKASPTDHHSQSRLATDTAVACH